MAGLEGGSAAGDLWLCWDSTAVAGETNAAKRMKMSSNAQPALRPGFVRPWSWCRFIHVSVQFTLWKVHIKCRKLG